MPGLFIIAGKPASGKSTLIARAAVRDNEQGCPVVLYDPSGDLSRYMVDMRGHARGVHVVSEGAPMSAAREKLTKERAPIVVFYTKDVHRFLAMAGAWVQVAGDMQRGFVYACDEAEMLFPNVTHGEKDLGPIRAALLTIARNRECRIYLATKRPQRLHVDARENATHVAVFRSDSEKFVDGCANFGNREDYERASTLEQGEYIYRPPFGGGKPGAFNTRDANMPFPSLLDSLGRPPNQGELPLENRH